MNQFKTTEILMLSGFFRTVFDPFDIFLITFSLLADTWTVLYCYVFTVVQSPPPHSSRCE